MSEVAIKPMTATEVDDGEVFVLVLLPQLTAFGADSPLEIEVCGRGILKWVEAAVGRFPSKQVEVFKHDDIMSIVRKNVGEHKYTAVVYADTPLLTTDTLVQAITYLGNFNHRACKMPRGWIFETDFIKTAEFITAADIPNLPPEDFIVAYNYTQVAVINNIMRGRILARHLSAGVHIIDLNTTYIDADVIIEKRVTIEPNVILKGSTHVKKGALIMSGSRITDSQIGENCVVNKSQITESEVGKGTTVGPNALLRTGSIVGEGCKIHNCVEIKKSTVGDKTKIAHMTYVGDSTLGEKCNIGCGVVFTSYDGKEKHQITVGNNVFVGSNSNLIAPLTLDDKAYIAAGSTITQDVPKNALGIARARQAVKEDWNTDTDTDN